MLVHQGGEHFVLLRRQVGQRRAHRAGIVTGDPGAGLDDADRVTGLAVADVQVRQEEVVDELADGGVIVAGDGVVEVHGGFRDEVEHRRGIHRHAQGLVGGGVDFGGRQAAQVGEALAQAATDRHHQFDIAQAILVADQVGAAFGQLFEQRGRQAADVAVVHHHADLDRLAHRFDVGGDAVLAGFGEVVGQQQQALGAQAFGFLGIFDGLAGGTADTGEDRHAAGAGIDGGLDHLAVLAGGQGEELTGTAGGEQGTGAVGGQPFQAFDVAGAMEIALGIEIGDREGQQAAGEDGFQFLWIHCF
ncbi:hypothetical protein D3C76_333120 [compost metagenome]